MRQWNKTYSCYGSRQRFRFIVGQCLVSVENDAWCVSNRHDALSDSDVKVCLSYDGIDTGPGSFAVGLGFSDDSSYLTSTTLHHENFTPDSPSLLSIPQPRGSLGHHRRFLNQFPPFFSFPFPHCPLGLGQLQACPFRDVVFPPLPLPALSSSPFHRALQDGFDQI